MRRQITVIVQDQAPIHKSKVVKERISKWQESGLYIFQLPKYCSQMNRIESEWLHIKEDEIAGKMFEDEYDLAICPSGSSEAIAVIQAVEFRASQKGYKVDRFRFNSQSSTA